jgi:hypothetical protein
MNITEESRRVFLMYAEDACNWSGNVPIGGNVGGSAQERGNLTQLKRAGLITTFDYDGWTWVAFTDSGRDYAKENGIEI